MNEEMNDLIDVSDIVGKADPNADWFTHNDVFSATFVDEMGKTISVKEAYEREDGSYSYLKALTYLSTFDTDREVVLGKKIYDDLKNERI